MTVQEAIKNRTSYRGKYESTKVPKENLKKIMEAGLAAPSGCNTQTTSLIAVDDPTILAQLYQIFNPKAEETAPAMVCVLTQKIIAYADVYFNVQDYSAAIQNMLLTAIELGYQSCWFEGQVTGKDKIGRKMADILNVPDDYEFVCFLPIGVAKGQLNHVAKKPFEERAWFNGFKK
jgi:nitroreductase